MKKAIKIFLIVIIAGVILYGTVVLSWLYLYTKSFEPGKYVDNFQSYSSQYYQLADFFGKIQPINQKNIPNRYYIYAKGKWEYVFDNKNVIMQDGKNIYDHMDALGISSLFHWEDWAIEFETKDWLLWSRDNIYLYHKWHFKNSKKNDEYNWVTIGRIEKKINDDWVILYSGD